MAVLLYAGVFNPTDSVTPYVTDVYADITLDSNILTNVSNTSDLVPGLSLQYNANIPYGTVILSVDGPTQITISNNAIGNETGGAIAMICPTDKFFIPAGNTYEVNGAFYPTDVQPGWLIYAPSDGQSARPLRFRISEIVSASEFNIRFFMEYDAPDGLGFELPALSPWLICEPSASLKLASYISATNYTSPPLPVALPFDGYLIQNLENKRVLDNLSVTGIQGAQGVTGVLGVDGQTGIQGETGIQGFTGIGGSDTYTGTAERTVGGITDGQSFTNYTMTQMWDQLIKQEKFPTLTAPSATFGSNLTGFVEIGSIVNLTFDSTFNRGSINPQYTALSPYRSGLPNAYDYVGSGLVDQSKTSLTDGQSVSGYTVIIGAQTWQGRVFYDAGVQPKSSYGNDYNTPLPAGNTSFITRTITGVYPVFATTVSISVLTKQTLAAHNAAYVQTDMVAESGGNKQTADFPVAWSAITGIQFFNTVSNAWEWINGSKANSLLTFSTSGTTHTIQGNVISYTSFVHNGATIGARQLRWYTT